jgi:hypothetical protein
MSKILSLCVIAALAVSIPSQVVQAEAAQSTTQVQSPCRVPGHAREQACVVVYKLVPGNDPVFHSTMTLDSAKALQGKAKAFSVIYTYKVKPSSPNAQIGLQIERGREGMMSDIFIRKPTNFWVTTNDGGRTWSKLTTTDMSSVISY